ncbi:putative signal peptide protein [Puccinia sorghi]|uniref:Putative signal peptide protein n=1 Tax=Puccinia sorghi TaxID=27349 RepID=A0A0L6UQW7_9BASI|nr:putative signal peptide protein [Puccinia sorghi]
MSLPCPCTMFLSLVISVYLHVIAGLSKKEANRTLATMKKILENLNSNHEQDLPSNNTQPKILNNGFNAGIIDLLWDGSCWSDSFILLINPCKSQILTSKLFLCRCGAYIGEVVAAGLSSSCR